MINSIESLVKSFYYVNFVRERGTEVEQVELSAKARLLYRRIRGENHGPAIFIHGVLPRSGTVYTGSLLRLHPDIEAYPNQMWEIPFLPLSGKILDMQKAFYHGYKQNAGKIGDQDFLPLFGAAMMAYLHSFVQANKRMLLKEPSTEFLPFFKSVFPDEHLLLLIRDGRDVVSSTLRTNSRANFLDTCMKWDRSARTMLAYDRNRTGNTSGYWMVKYEDVVKAPEPFVREACHRFGLRENRYPFDAIKSIPVRGSSVLRKDNVVTWEAMDKPAGFNPVGRWADWPSRLIRAFNWIAGRTLSDLGY